MPSMRSLGEEAVDEDVVDGQRGRGEEGERRRWGSLAPALRKKLRV